jgi:hypothetical protein
LDGDVLRADHVSTEGSDFDTTLGVYTGSTVNALTLVAGNDDFGPGLTSSVTFNAVAGNTYQIAVDGFGGQAGNIVLTRAGDPGTSPFVIIQSSDPSAKEGAGDSGTFTLSRSGSTTNLLTVRLVITGTAANGTDYETVADSVSFAAGASTASIRVNTVDDALVERTKM